MTEDSLSVAIGSGFFGSAVFVGVGILVIFSSAISQKTWGNVEDMIARTIIGMALILLGTLIFLITIVFAANERETRVRKLIHDAIEAKTKKEENP